MIFPMFAAIIFDALILCLALYLLAKHEADYSFPKCAMVAAPIAVAPPILALLLAEHVGVLLILIGVPLLMFPFAVYLVSKYCWVPWPKAIAVVIAFYVGHAIVNTGIAALRREFQKPVARVERRQPERDAAAERERQAIEHPTRAEQPAKKPAETVALSPRDGLLAAARERLERRLPLSGPLDAISTSLRSSPEVVLDSVSFRSASTGSGGEGVLAVSVRIPSAGEQAVVRLMDRVKNEPAFHAPWRVVVKSFAVDSSPGASKNARVAVIECACRTPAPSATPSGAAFSDADAQWARSSVLVPRLGNYLQPATERIETAAAAARLSVASVGEMGIRQTPTGAGGTAMATYTVMASGVWALEEVARLTAALEKEPLLQVGALEVKPGSGAKKADARLDIEWPIWREPAKAEAMLQGAPDA